MRMEISSKTSGEDVGEGIKDVGDGIGEGVEDLTGGGSRDANQQNAR